MFDIDKFLTTSVMEVNATRIRFQDSRTGEMFDRTIYRPGKTISFQNLAKEMAHYGFILQWVDDEERSVPGHMNWANAFGMLIQEQEA